MPFFGSFFSMVCSSIKSKKSGDNFHAVKHMVDDSCAPDSVVTVAFHINNTPGLSICDPEVVQELYTTKNKYFDKHPLVKDLTFCLTGDSILFAETTKDWKASRKALAPAFYKTKLDQLTLIAKKAIRKTLEHHQMILKNSYEEWAEVDVIKEMNEMTTRIML